MSYGWKGALNQSRQTGFGLQRSSPQTYGGANQVAKTGANASAVEQDVAEPLEEPTRDTIMVFEDEFVEMARLAQVDLFDDDFVALAQEANF